MPGLSAPSGSIPSLTASVVSDDSNSTVSSLVVVRYFMKHLISVNVVLCATEAFAAPNCSLLQCN